MTTSKMKVNGETLTIAQLENFVPSVDGKPFENVSEVSLISMWVKNWPFEKILAIHWPNMNKKRKRLYSLNQFNPMASEWIYESLLIQKNSNSISRTPRGHLTFHWKYKLKCFLQVFKFFFSPPGGAGDLKLQPFDSESKTTSDCSNRLFSKKITPDSYFSFYH